MALHDHVVPLIVEGRTAELAEALIDLPGYALTNLPAGCMGPALDWLVEADRLNEALVLYHSAHAVQAALPLPLSLAEGFAARGLPDLALDLLKGWREGARKRPGEYLTQADALERFAGAEAALPVMAAAARAFPQSGAFASHHARLLLETGDTAAALAELDRGLEADPIQPPWVRGLRAALSGAPVTLGMLTLELPLDLLRPGPLLEILRGQHRAATRAAAQADLPEGATIHDAAAGPGVLALLLASAAPGATVSASDPDAPLAALAVRNLTANGLAGALTGALTEGQGASILITRLTEAAPEIPATVTRLILEPAPGLPPAALTAHLTALFAAGFTLDLAAGGADLVVLSRLA